ncbi:MAG: hypothetical protein LBU40_05540, partial [Methanobrevibacter sp.]|nr:hypothetical protein [Methanobrevibacter sp.]
MSKNNKDAIEIIKSAIIAEKKIVTIWGAGTSVKSGIPTGAYILDKMKEDIKRFKNTKEFREKFDKNELKNINRAIRNLKDEYGEEYSFEFILGVYEKFYDNEGLSNWIEQFISPKKSKNKLHSLPTFSHEYSSHLLSNQNFKYFISLNFDEILEKAITREIGYENFQIISTESEFQKLENLDIEKWDDEFEIKPKGYVFKPHGTIAHKKSLRHTDEKVKVLEDETRKVLTEVMKDAVIVLMGFSNYNEDFWILFGETYSRALTGDIIILGMSKNSVKNIEDRFPPDRHIIEIYNYVNDSPIDDFFKDLSEELRADNIYKRQTPTRHYIRSLFFSLFYKETLNHEAKKSDSKEKAYRDFFKKLEKIPSKWFDMHIYELELLIYLIKSRGLFIQTSTSHCPRIRNAYEKCLKNYDEKDLKPHKVLKKILNFEKENDLIFDYSPVINLLGEKTFYMVWCFLLLNSDVCGKFEFKETNKKIVERYVSYLEDSIKNLEKEEEIDDLFKFIKYNFKKINFKNELIKSFNNLFDDFDVDFQGNNISDL